MKRCGACKEIKPLSEYHVCKGSRDGKQSRCKSCNKDRAKKWYSITRNAMAVLVRGARRRALSQGLDCDIHLHVSEIVRRAEMKVCELTGERLCDPGRTGERDLSPSIDRIDSSRGYTIDNIRIVSWKVNNMMREYGALELLRVADAIRAHQAKQEKP